MNVRKPLLVALLILALMATLVSACSSTAAPAAVPTAAPAAAQAAAPTSAPAAQPTAAPKPAAAFDMKAALDKYLSALPEGFSTIAPAALKDQMAAAKPFIVDVREATEIADNGFIEGSVNIPIRTFAKNLDRMPAKDQPIVVTCAGGHRAAIAMAALQMLGYTNVKSLTLGFRGWTNANMPVVKGKPADPVVGKAPEVDKELLAAFDKYLSALPDGWGTIQAPALNEQLAVAKPFQLDVREAKEIADNGYIAGSVNVPIRNLIKSLDKLPADKSAAIIAECGSGHRSAIAMMALNMVGYTNVKSLVNGFGAWKAANLPIAK